MVDFELNVEFDDQGNIILPNGENDDIPRKKIDIQNDNDFVNEDDLQEFMDAPPSDEKEAIGKPKLQKSGLPKHMRNQPRQDQPQKDQIIESDFTMDDVQKKESNFKLNNADPIKLLVLGAKRIEHKINIELTLNSLDKNLYNILSDSYPDDKDKILNIILDQNKNEIQELVKQSISTYYGKIE